MASSWPSPLLLLLLSSLVLLVPRASSFITPGTPCPRRFSCLGGVVRKTSTTNPTTSRSTTTSSLLLVALAAAPGGASSSSLPGPVSALLSRLRGEGGGASSSIMFADVMAAINDSGYVYTPKAFMNGPIQNEAGTNEGSSKLLSLGRLLDLDEQEVLACWGEHYRGVLDDPQGSSHANIRAFMQTGWAAVTFPQGLSLTIPTTTTL